MVKPNGLGNVPHAPRRRALLRDSAAWLGSALAFKHLLACTNQTAQEQTGTAASVAGLEMDALGPRVPCQVVTQFPAIVDLGLRSTFTRMDHGDQAEWLITGVSAALYAVQLPDCVLFMLRSLDNLYLGYPISMLAHSLQAATRAKRANASDDLILSALCHHLGVLLTVEGQAELSAAILRGFVSEHAYRVVRHHAEYQWSAYGSLVGLPTSQRERYAAEPWHADAVRFSDDWDSPAYDRRFVSSPLAEFEPLVRAKFGPESGYLVGQLTSSDCV